MRLIRTLLVATIAYVLLLVVAAVSWWIGEWMVVGVSLAGVVGWVLVAAGAFSAITRGEE